MVVNLDLWFNQENWSSKQLMSNQATGVDVIDNCLRTVAMPSLPITPQAQSRSTPTNDKDVAKKAHASPSGLNGGRKYRSPRKKSAPAKLLNYVWEPSGYCPKCSIYVKHTDQGVACVKCRAFWHYACVGVTQNEMDEYWSIRPFLCPEHRAAEAESNTEVKYPLIP